VSGVVTNGVTLKESIRANKLVLRARAATRSASGKAGEEESTGDQDGAELHDRQAKTEGSAREIFLLWFLLLYPRTMIDERIEGLASFKTLHARPVMRSRYRRVHKVEDSLVS
jgi:hypothetical protein